MYSKASTLFERAAYQAYQYSHSMVFSRWVHSCILKFHVADMGPNEAAIFTSSFAALNGSITRFVVDLPPISQLEMTLPAAIRTIFITHTLAHSASLRLHMIFADADDHSREKCVASAVEIMTLVQNVDLQNFQYINPIVGVSRGFVTSPHSQLIWPSRHSGHPHVRFS